MLLAADTVLTGSVVGARVDRGLWGAGDRRRIRNTAAPPDVDLGAVTVVPGFVITRSRWWRASFAGGVAETATVVDMHRRHGTTTLIAPRWSPRPRRPVGPK